MTTHTTAPTDAHRIQLTPKEAKNLEAKYDTFIPCNAPEIADRYTGSIETCPHCGEPMPWQGYIMGNCIRWLQVREACTCPGAVAEAAAQEEQRRKEEENRKAKEHAERVERLRRQSGMSARDAAKTFATAVGDRDNQDALDAAKAYAAAYIARDKTGKPSLYIEGDIGTGKTHLAACIANEILNAGRRVVYTTLSAYLLKIRATYDNHGGNETEDAIKHDVLSAPLLFLDDLGKERATDWSLAQLFALIDYRYSHGLPTVITSNYAIDALQDRLTPSGGERMTAEAICDRLAEDCNVLTLRGNSRRRN